MSEVQNEYSTFVISLKRLYKSSALSTEKLNKLLENKTINKQEFDYILRKE